MMLLHEEAGDTRTVMCTRCPTPCEKCRARPQGPYCDKTPCDCACHRKTTQEERIRHLLDRVRGICAAGDIALNTGTTLGTDIQAGLALAAVELARYATQYDLALEAKKKR